MTLGLHCNFCHKLAWMEKFVNTPVWFKNCYMLPFQTTLIDSKD